MATSSAVGGSAAGGSASALPAEAAGAGSMSPAQAGAYPEPKKRRAQKGSSTDHLPGKRTMKEYPVTEETFDTIGVLRTSAALGFSFGSLCLGFALSSWQAVSMADPTTVAPATIASWTAYGWSALIGAVIFYAGGIVYAFKGGSVVQKVKDGTSHD